ncbi:T9SS type A sorting domain-containing protein [Bacteroidales bacterium OttesenSCG-928-M06]|nr:T9SS type A sorting domain-containing protein [Bacteroidales bacterium OttesenSCG-928-M06]
MRKILFLVLGFALSILCLQAQDTKKCGTISTLVEKVQDSSCGSTGIIKVTVTEQFSTPSSKVITLELQGSNGGISIPQSTIPASEKGTYKSVYYLEGLSAGDYTVIARKYCAPGWESDTELPSSTAQGAISLTTNHTALSVDIQTTGIRKPLADCFYTGYIPFKITGGSLPYSIIIDNGPIDMIGKTYVFDKKSKNDTYTFFELPVGEYTFTIKDVCNYSVERLLTLTPASGSLYTEQIQADRVNDHESSCDELYASVRAIGTELNQYVSSLDSMLKYIDLKWYIEGIEETKYDAVFKLDLLNYKGPYLVMPGNGIDFSYLKEQKKTIVLEASLKLPEGADASCDKKTHAFKRQQFGQAEKTYIFTLESVSGNCTPSLKFPLKWYPNLTPLCFPVSYIIEKKNDDDSYSRWTDEEEQNTWTWDYSNSTYNYHNPGEGTYRMTITDSDNYSWTQELTIGGPEAVNPSLTIIRVNDRYTGIPEDYITDEDEGTLVTTYYNMNNTTGMGVTATYVQVPDNFHFNIGDTQYISSTASRFYVNRDYSESKTTYYQLVPGTYQIKFVTDCGVETLAEPFTVYSSYFKDDLWDYELTRECNSYGLRLKTNRVVFKNPSHEDNTDNSLDDSNTSSIYVRIKSYPDQSYSTSEYVKVGGAATLPLPLKGEYRLEFSKFNNADDKRWTYTRTIVVDRDPAAEMYFDYTKTGGYICPNNSNATITALAIEGVAPYTYYLYDQEERPDYTTTPTITLEAPHAENEIAVFEYGNNGESYWIGARDACGTYFPQQVTVYSLSGTLIIKKDRGICNEKDVVLSTLYIQGGKYTWYRGGTIENNEVVGGTVIEGETTETLKISAATADDEGVYHVHVKHDGCGINLIGSVNLEVAPPAIYVKDYSQAGAIEPAIKDGTSWETAFGDLNEALEYAFINKDCVKEIWVAEGTYLPSMEYGDGTDPRKKSFVLPSGVNIYGGFPANATTSNNYDKDDITQRNWEEWRSVLSGELGQDGNAYHVVIAYQLSELTEFNGFVIEGGNTQDSSIDKWDTGTLPDNTSFHVPTGYGAGIYTMAGAGTLYGKNLVIQNNHAIKGGGVASFENNPIVFVNTLVANNSACDGGGFYFYGFPARAATSTSIPTLTNVTIADNKSTCNTYGAGIDSMIPIEINNSIIWGNEGSDGSKDNIDSGIYVSEYSQGSFDISNSIIQGKEGASDPHFKGGGSTDHYHLTPESTNAINKGDNDKYKEIVGGTIPTNEKDLAANDRIQGEAIDMGAYESPITCPFPYSTVYVKDFSVDGVTGKDGDGSGADWDNAHPDLAYVLYIANKYPGCVKVIKVTEGKYYPKYDPEGNRYENPEEAPRDVTFIIPNDIIIEGAYPKEATSEEGNATTENDRNSREHETILTGDIGKPGEKGDNAYHVVIIPGTNPTSPGPVIDGVTIKDGNANCSGNDCTTTIGDKKIPNDKGGGVIVNVNDSKPVIKNSTITENNSDSDGAGIYGLGKTTIELINVVIDHNISAGNGGGIANGDPSNTTINITNVTVANNEAETGGGISGPVNMVNTIVWKNTDSQTTTDSNPTGNIYNGTGNAIKNSLIEGANSAKNGEDPEWNINYGSKPEKWHDFNPGFVSADNKNGKGQYDYTLGESSPAVDKGQDALYIEAINRIDPDKNPDYDEIENIDDKNTFSKDAYWNDRKEYEAIDLGAVESMNYCPPILVWTPFNSSQEWNDAKNWTPKYAPKACTDVYIPGDATIFPSLTANKDLNNCRDIYFAPGAQLGRPDRLTYRFAHVQIDYNGKASESPVKEDNITGKATIEEREAITSKDRVQFAATHSGVTLQRGRWNMLAAPLKNIVTGDFAFGGFPYSFIKQFDADGTNDTYIKGKWADFNNRADEAFSPGQGFGHYFYPYVEGTPFGMDNSLNDTQWEKAKSTNGLTANAPEPVQGSNEFGLAQSNGIVHIPFFEDSEYLSPARREHKYTGSRTVENNEIKIKGTSEFHVFWQTPLLSNDYLNWTGQGHSVERSESAYKFITDGNWNFSYEPGTFSTGDFILLGNPYMSALSFDAFDEANKVEGKRIIKGTYLIYQSPNVYVEYDTNNKFIAPMQSFLVEVATDVTEQDIKIEFNAEMAVTDKKTVLKADEETLMNQIKISAENKYGKIQTVVRQSESAEDEFCNEDFSKIIDAPDNLPHIYTLTAMKDGKMRALLKNSVKSKQIVVPIGLASTFQGEIKINLNGMDKYDARIYFIDMDAKVLETEITGKDTFTYSFDYAGSKAEPNMENRFALRFAPKNMTKIEQLDGNSKIIARVEGNDLLVFSTKEDIDKVELYDLKGSLIYRTEVEKAAQIRLNNALTQNGVYMVKVFSSKGMNAVKVIKK